MQQQKNGVRYLVVLASLLSLLSCKQSKPPAIEICILDGVGGADCIERDGTKVYKVPSELMNYWATNQDDQAAFASWCYGAQREHVNQVMEQIAVNVRGSR